MTRATPRPNYVLVVTDLHAQARVTWPKCGIPRLTSWACCGNISRVGPRKPATVQSLLLSVHAGTRVLYLCLHVLLMAVCTRLACYINVHALSPTAALICGGIYCAYVCTHVHLATALMRKVMVGATNEAINIRRTNQDHTGTDAHGTDRC